MGCTPGREAAEPTRRSVLVAAALVALASAACGPGYDRRPDPLVGLARLARADEGAADALAAEDTEAAGGTDAADVAGAVARVRREHAAALEVEIERANRPRAESAEPREVPVPDLAALGARLTSAITRAREQLPSLPGHRAGLLGSVAAGCAAAQQLDPELDERAPAALATEAYDAELPHTPASALQTALGSEHAAIWMLQTARAFLADEVDERVDRALADHRERRDACREMLASVGREPELAEPAYRPPEPVDDAESALGAVEAAEQDCGVAWRGVLERVTDDGPRGLAFEALLRSGALHTVWREALGKSPTAVALVGHR